MLSVENQLWSLSTSISAITLRVIAGRRYYLPIIRTQIFLLVTPLFDRETMVDVKKFVSLVEKNNFRKIITVCFRTVKVIKSII